MEHVTPTTKQNTQSPGKGFATRHASIKKPPLHPILQLQRQMGNQAILAMLRSGALQAKLAVGSVDDPLEYEANRIANHVMRMTDPRPSISQAPPQVGRKCAACKEKQKILQTKPAGSAKPIGDAAPAIVHDVLRSSGQPLDHDTRSFFEPRLGFDFSRVRVHVSSEAGLSAQAISAHAYTVGSHIVFASGRFAPWMQDGRRLLAHELVHVVQQGAAAPVAQRSSDQAAPVKATRSGGGTAFLRRFLSSEPAGGCGLCYGTPANAGKAAHALIQQEFEVSYPLGLAELGVSSPSDDNGRLDLAVAVPGGFEIGEIKPANAQGYEDGILQIGTYIGLLQARYPGVAIKPLTKLLPPTIFPTLSTQCPVQILFVNPPVGGVYGYHCQPSFAQLLSRGCTCPPPRLRQTEQQQDVKEKNKKERTPSARQNVPVEQPSVADRIFKFIKEILTSGASVEAAVMRFLKDNPDILENIEKIVAGIIALDIVSDVLSGGAAITKDPAILAILSAMLRIARALRAAAPVLAAP